MIQMNIQANKTFLSGYNFSTRCDYIFASTIDRDPSNKKENTGIAVCKNNLNDVKDNDLVFCKTDFIPNLKESLEGKNVKIHVITHESDCPITEQLFNFLHSEKIISWRAINVEFEHEKLKPIPLGIANDYCSSTLKYNDMAGTKKVKSNKLVYINNRIQNYPKERKILYENFSTNEYWTVRNPWEISDIYQYREELLNHKFCMCPRGNGIDTHRFWECLYLGIIPVVVNNYNMSHFDELPVLFVDSFTDLIGEENYLEKIYNDFSSQTWNFNKLKIDWWLN
jgi:hypothetical protein